MLFAKIDDIARALASQKSDTTLDEIFKDYSKKLRCTYPFYNMREETIETFVKFNYYRDKLTEDAAKQATE